MDILVEFQSNGKAGLGTASARYGDKVLAVEAIKIGKSKDRTAFVDQVLAVAPEADRADIETALLELAAREIEKPEPPPEESAELDVTAIVRPELLHTPEVSGIAVPSTRQFGLKLIASWALYLRWHDTGKRERIEPLPESLELPNGRRLWIFPQPGEPNPTMRSGWTVQARRLWLAGKAAPNPAAVFQETCELFAYFLHFTKDIAAGATATLACWTMLTYVYPCWPSVPYLSVGGPLHSGKTTVFRVLGKLCFRPLESSNMTAPCLFRTIHDCGGTLLLDEVERLRENAPDAGELRSILLSGYKAGSPAMRLEKNNTGGFSRIAFDVYGPKALASITRLPEALASRCIRIGMFRAEPGSPKPRRRLTEKNAEFRALRDDLHAIALEHGPTWIELVTRESVTPANFAGREFELWGPLLAIGSWLEEHGLIGVVELLTGFATGCIEDSEDDNLPDAEVALLSILAYHVRGGTAATLKASDILKIACEQHPTLFGPVEKPRWSPRGIGAALRRYGLRTKKGHGSSGRTYRLITEEQLRAVERAYTLEFL